jgi:hypothetical protein
VNAGGPRLVLLARLAEAARWDDLTRRHESDPWAYMRRKLLETADPLRAYKRELLAEAKGRLLADLEKPFLPPGALETHREAFESLLSPGDFADLAFHLDPRAERAARLEGARAALAAASPPTAFELEALPPERRGRAWQRRVDELAARLRLDVLSRLAERGTGTPKERAYLARRLRRELGEYLSVTRSEHGGVRDEVTPFMLTRLEAAIAASLRFLGRWR